MRELTDAEIELFDFTGRIPDLHVASLGKQKQAVVATTQMRSRSTVQSTAKRPAKKRGFRFGSTRTA